MRLGIPFTMYAILMASAVGAPVPEENSHVETEGNLEAAHIGPSYSHYGYNSYSHAPSYSGDYSSPRQGPPAAPPNPVGAGGLGPNVASSSATSDSGIETGQRVKTTSTETRSVTQKIGLNVPSAPGNPPRKGDALLAKSPSPLRTHTIATAHTSEPGVPVPARAPPKKVAFPHATAPKQRHMVVTTVVTAKRSSATKLAQGSSQRDIKTGNQHEEGQENIEAAKKESETKVSSDKKAGKGTEKAAHAAAPAVPTKKLVVDAPARVIFKNVTPPRPSTAAPKQKHAVVTTIVTARHSSATKVVQGSNQGDIETANKLKEAQEKVEAAKKEREAKASSEGKARMGAEKAAHTVAVTKKVTPPRPLTSTTTPKHRQVVVTTIVTSRRSSATTVAQGTKKLDIETTNKGKEAQEKVEAAKKGRETNGSSNKKAGMGTEKAAHTTAAAIPTKKLAVAVPACTVTKKIVSPRPSTAAPKQRHALSTTIVTAGHSSATQVAQGSNESGTETAGKERGAQEKAKLTNEATAAKASHGEKARKAKEEAPAHAAKEEELAREKVTDTNGGKSESSTTNAKVETVGKVMSLNHKAEKSVKQGGGKRGKVQEKSEADEKDDIVTVASSTGKDESVGGVIEISGSGGEKKVTEAAKDHGGVSMVTKHSGSGNVSSNLKLQSGEANVDRVGDTKSLGDVSTASTDSVSDNVSSDVTVNGRGATKTQGAVFTAVKSGGNDENSGKLQAGEVNGTDGEKETISSGVLVSKSAAKNGGNGGGNGENSGKLQAGGSKGMDGDNGITTNGAQNGAGGAQSHNEGHSSSGYSSYGHSYY